MTEKGVVGLSRRPAVDQDFGETVDAVEHQVGMRRKIGGQFEIALINPVVEFVWAQEIDVFSEEGVRNDSVPVEIKFDVAGYFGRHFRHVDCAGPAEEPPAVEKELLHEKRTFPVDEFGSMRVPRKSLRPAFQRRPSFL